MNAFLAIADMFKNFGAEIIVLYVVEPSVDNLSQNGRLGEAGARNQEIQPLLGFR